MIDGIRAEGETSAVAAFEFDEELFVFGAEAVEDFRADGDEDVVIAVRVFLEDRVETALDFDRHGFGGFEAAVACAGGAGVVDGGAEAFVEPLSGHFHEAERGDGEDLGFGFVAAEPILHDFVDGLLIAAVFHVDEVDDDETAHVAEAELAGDFLGGFEVGLEDGFFEVIGALITAGVDVDGEEGLGFVDDDVAAAFEPDLAEEGVIDLFLDAEVVEDGFCGAETVDAFFGAAADLADELAHAFGGFLVVADDLIDLFGEEVADRAFDEIGFVEGAGWGVAIGGAFGDLVPLFDEHGEVADEVAGAFALTDRAHDDAHAFGDIEFAEDFPETLAFLGVVDFPADAEHVVERHEDEEAAGETDVGGDARALVADGAFGDLDEEFRADWVERGDVLGGDFLGFELLTAGAFDVFDVIAAAFFVVGGWDGVPEVEEGIFFEPDVDEHGFEALFDVFDAAFVDGADDVLSAGAFDGVFLEHAVLDEGDALFEAFGIDDDADAFVEVRAAAEETADAIDDPGDRGGLRVVRVEAGGLSRAAIDEDHGLEMTPCEGVWGLGLRRN